MMNSNDYSYEVALNRVPNTSIIDKFGFNLDVDTGGEEIVASFGGAYDPTSDIITSAQTFTITYNSGTDGEGTTGALTLLIFYLDGNFNLQQATHTLGSDGSDVTEFTGLGINRVKVGSSGTAGYNVNDITITATTDATNQAQVPAESSVTQQCIYHGAVNREVLLDKLRFTVLKVAAGQTPKVTVRGYVWDRTALTRYRIFDIDIDTTIENSYSADLKPFRVDEKSVIYFTATTTVDNTKIALRFGGSSQ